jgi:hypothetical protein
LTPYVWYSLILQEEYNMTMLEILACEKLVMPGETVSGKLRSFSQLENIHGSIAREYGPYHAQIFAQMVGDIDFLDCRDASLQSSLVKACTALPPSWQWNKAMAAPYNDPSNEYRMNAREALFIRIPFLRKHWYELRPDQQTNCKPFLLGRIFRTASQCVGVSVPPYKAPAPAPE